MSSNVQIGGSNAAVAISEEVLVRQRQLWFQAICYCQVSEECKHQSIQVWIECCFWGVCVYFPVLQYTRQLYYKHGRTKIQSSWFATVIPCIHVPIYVNSPLLALHLKRRWHAMPAISSTIPSSYPRIIRCTPSQAPTTTSLPLKKERTHQATTQKYPIFIYYYPLFCCQIHQEISR